MQIMLLRFLSFGAVGITGILVNLTILYLGQEFAFRAVHGPQTRLNLSLAVAILFATINNFTWNRRWTWHDRPLCHGRHLFRQFAQYALACWISIAMQVVFTNMLAPRFNYVLANLTAIMGASMVNFVVNNFWTFRLRITAEGAAAGPAASARS
jgi:putative flippase GtrA